MARKKPLRRFTRRETFLITESLKNERDEALKTIQKMEAEGKHPMFTQGFIKREINDLIELVESNERKNRKFK